MNARAATSLLMLLLGVWPAAGLATPTDDAYVAGYASAVVERSLGLPGSVTVRDGVVTVRTRALSVAERDDLERALREVAGVRDVVVREDLEQEPAAPQVAVAPDGAVTGAVPVHAGRFLPRGLLFEPLHADPRWPHFAAAYRYYIDDRDLGNVGAADFGETIPFWRDAGLGGEWEVGLQAGVFSVFNLDAPSNDLVNADYMGGIFGAWRRDRASAFLRLFHQSSHLGDEFLLRNRVDRVNLSYEQIDLTLSYQLFDPVRLYAGGGSLLRTDPSSLERPLVLYGVELTSPMAYCHDAVRPVFYASFNQTAESGWRVDASLRGGVRFDGWDIGARQLYLLVEWFDGRSPNGQFYVRDIQTVGIGAHLFF